MADDIRNTLLDDYPDAPDKEAILLQLQGDLIDSLAAVDDASDDELLDASSGGAVEDAYAAEDEAPETDESEGLDDPDGQDDLDESSFDGDESIEGIDDAGVEAAEEDAGSADAVDADEADDAEEDADAAGAEGALGGVESSEVLPEESDDASSAEPEVEGDDTAALIAELEADVDAAADADADADPDADADTYGEGDSSLEEDDEEQAIAEAFDEQLGEADAADAVAAEVLVDGEAEVAEAVEDADADADMGATVQLDVSKLDFDAYEQNPKDPSDATDDEDGLPSEDKE